MKPKKFFIHSCTSKSYSGLERYVIDVASGQMKDGHDVVLFCRKKSALEKHALEKGIPVWTIGFRQKATPFLWARMTRPWRKYLRKGNEAILHMHAGGELLYHLPWLMKRPKSLLKVILQFHIWINHQKNDPFHRSLYNGLDEVWCSSSSAAEHLEKLLPIKKKQIRILPYGRDIARLQSLPKESLRTKFREKYGAKDKDFLFLCISRIEPIKGIRELFDAFLKIAPQHPTAKLWIVGDVSPENEEAENFYKDLKKDYEKLNQKLKSQIQFLGFLPESEQVLCAADVYVLPTYEECMSLALLDALILGLPVIGTNSGGTPSVVIPAPKPEATGYLVPPKNALALAEAMEKAIKQSSTEQFNTYKRNAEKLASSFNSETVFKNILKFYES